MNGCPIPKSKSIITLSVSRGTVVWILRELSVVVFRLHFVLELGRISIYQLLICQRHHDCEFVLKFS
jgi:hypothetical protein